VLEWQDELPDATRVSCARDKSAKSVTTVVLTILVMFVGLALVTRGAVTMIERGNPPQGQFVDVRGARLHFVDIGPRDVAEPPLVLIHGASANLQTMRQPLGDMLANDHRVILFDRPGHGWSMRNSLADSTPQAQADTIAEGLDRLSIRRAVIVGHSWGGALVSALAVRHPERVAGIVMLARVTHPWRTGVAWYHTLAAIPLLGPFFAYTLELPIAYPMLTPGAHGAFLPQAAPDDYVSATALPLLIRPREFLTNGRDVITLKPSIHALQPHYHEIAVPTVVIHGDADHTVSIAIHARTFVSEVKGATLIELKGIGHMCRMRRPISSSRRSNP
jgi:pimeloyl-ACP methyl ester carboxylesterase